MEEKDYKALAANLAPVIKSQIEAATAPLVARIKELEGREPAAGPKGEPGSEGAPGAKGVDGASLTNAHIDRTGNLVLTLSDGSQKDLGLVVGKSVPASEIETLVKGAVTAAVAALPVPKDGRDGTDGKDIEPEFVRGLIKDAVAALPVPKDGRDGQDGRNGTDGKDTEIETVKSLVKAAVAEIPVPKDGQNGTPGRDGKDVDVETVKTLVKESVAAIPVPKDGKDGIDGRDGNDIDPDVIRQMVKSAVAEIPTPKDGASGINGKDGRDGLDVKDLLVVEDGSLVATFSDGRSKNLGRFRGVDGAPGRDGKNIEIETVKALVKDAVDAIPVPKDGEDGVGFDDVEFADTPDGFMLRFVRGDIVKEARLPIPRDCGVYKVGTVYNKGDGISFAGSFWIAQKDGVTEKPEGGEGWRLSVKRGRDRTDPVSR